MSRRCTSGRHGEPSLWSRTLPVVTACPTRLFTTMSARRRRPYAVALRKYTGEKLSLASSCSACSTRTLESPYGVTG